MTKTLLSCKNLFFLTITTYKLINHAGKKTPFSYFYKKLLNEDAGVNIFCKRTQEENNTTIERLTIQNLENRITIRIFAIYTSDHTHYLFQSASGDITNSKTTIFAKSFRFRTNLTIINLTKTL